MCDVEALIAEAKNPDAFRLEAYYYSFEPTGVIEIDRILSAVARAGKAFHNTEQWDEDAYGKWKPVELIQTAANEAAKALEGLVSAPTGDEAGESAAWDEFRDGPDYQPTDRYDVRSVFHAGFTARLPVVSVPSCECGSGVSRGECHPALTVPTETSERERNALTDAVGDGLAEAMLCHRVWEAWQVGTMTEDDFSQASDDDEFVAQIVDSVIAVGLPVVSVPVYEYGVAPDGELDGVGDTFHSAREAGQWAETGDGDFVARRVKAGEWEPVGVDKP